MRRVIAALVVVGLAVAVVLLWPRATMDDTPATLAGPTTTTSTSTTAPPTSTTTTVPNSTTTTADSHVVETVEEAEAILRELWFGWFEGIYNEDEDRIREVVVLEETVETAKESFGTSPFEARPQSDDIGFNGTEILRSDEECLVIWTAMSLSSFRDGSSEAVHVLRRFEGEWRRLSLWTFREDLWDMDCESQLFSQ